MARAVFALLLLSVVAAAHVARGGTLSARAAAATLVASALLLLVVRALRARRSLSTPGQVIRKVLISTQRDLGERTLRAFNLLEQKQSLRGQSAELADLHFERLVQRASLDAVSNLGKRRARIFAQLALLLLGTSTLVAVAAPLRLLEGLDVLAARNGRAPVDMRWLERPRIDGRPPSYLRQQDSVLALDSAAVLPEGTELSVRGRALHQDRELVLTDGVEQVPFVDDGSGALVAHWTLTRTVELKVAAKFGDVLIHEPRVLQLHSQRDRVPSVQLEGAPAEHELDKLEKLELRWSAIDDHSISQVDLVLRSGGRIERRTLERYPSDKRRASGGYVLYPHDAFLKRIFLPVTVRIEARDNDARQGSKWGQSAPIVLKPPTVGSPQNARYAALKALRDRLVDFLGKRIELDAIEEPKAKAEARRQLLEELTKLETEGLDSLAKEYQGLAVPRGWLNFARGQLERLRLAYRNKRNELKATEEAVLAIDSPLGSLAFRDAQAVAKQLGDVAEEAALGARQAQESEARDAGVERLDIAISVLRDGAKQLQALGVLGADLGNVALADLGRVTRSREQLDMMHAELAALHMAARLHRPNPSYSSKGGGGGGTESGGGRSGGSGTDAQGDPSQADKDFNRLAEDLARLAQEHGDAVDRTSMALDSAESGLETEQLSEEAKQRAEQLRRSAVHLPQPGERPGTGRASAALAREHTGAMAHDLERLALDEALESGRRARAAAEDAQRRGVDPQTQAQLQRTLSELKEQIAWAEQLQRQIQQQKEQAAQKSLSEIGELERELSERARRMSEEASGQAALPQDVRDRLSQAQRFMEEAANRLRSGEGEVGLNLQRSAQRLLEESETGQTGGEEQDQRGPDGEQTGKRRVGTGGDVPDPEADNGAEEFRRRVLQGLGKRGGGRLSKAVKRYAEGLLR